MALYSSTQGGTSVTKRNLPPGTKSSNSTRASAPWLLWANPPKPRYLHPTTATWNISLCSKWAQEHILSKTSSTWCPTQVLSSSAALPFVSFLLPNSPAPTAALINSLVPSSALLPKKENASTKTEYIWHNIPEGMLDQSLYPALLLCKQGKPSLQCKHGEKRSGSLAVFPSEATNSLLKWGESQDYLCLLQFQFFYLLKQCLCLLLLQLMLLFLLSHSFQRFPSCHFVTLLFEFGHLFLFQRKENSISG